MCSLFCEDKTNGPQAFLVHNLDMLTLLLPEIQTDDYMYDYEQVVLLRLKSRRLKEEMSIILLHKTDPFMMLGFSVTRKLL